MSIPTEGYLHPTVMAAILQAAELIDRWIDHHDDPDWQESAREAVDWWPGCVLRESIATALLEAQGFDIEGFELAVGDVRRGETDGDRCGMWRERLKEWEGENPSVIT